jgi:hypothetical protein
MGRGEEIGHPLASCEGRGRPWGGMKPLHVRFGTPCRFIPFYEEVVIGIRTEIRKAQMSSDPTTRNDYWSKRSG